MKKPKKVYKFGHKKSIHRFYTYDEIFINRLDNPIKIDSTIDYFNLYKKFFEKNYKTLSNLS